MKRYYKAVVPLLTLLLSGCFHTRFNYFEVSSGGTAMSNLSDTKESAPKIYTHIDGGWYFWCTDENAKSDLSIVGLRVVATESRFFSVASLTEYLRENVTAIVNGKEYPVELFHVVGSSDHDIEGYVSFKDCSDFGHSFTLRIVTQSKVEHHVAFELRHADYWYTPSQLQ